MEIMLWWDHLGCNLQGCFCLCVSTDLTRVFSYFSNSAKVHFPGSDRFWSLHFVFSLSSWLIFLKQARWTLHSGMFNRWPSHPKVAPRAAPWRNLRALGQVPRNEAGAQRKPSIYVRGKRHPAVKCESPTHGVDVINSQLRLVLVWRYCFAFIDP